MRFILGNEFDKTMEYLPTKTNNKVENLILHLICQKEKCEIEVIDADQNIIN